MERECPWCGAEMEEVEEPGLLSAVPFPYGKAAESVWEAARLKLAIFECPECGLLLTRKRRESE